MTATRGTGDETPSYSRPGESSATPRHRIEQGEMLPETAYQIVHDETMLDGNARLNLATFVTTWMDESADKIYAESYDKNMIDKDEYPQTAKIEDDCWHMVANLWNVPDAEKTIGTSTIGSSEACMLGGLAFKRRWQHARKAAGKSTDKPNLVMSSAVQVCWEKFCNYFEVEARYVPVSAEHKMLDGFELDKYVDENTIGVVAIMGVTYTGTYEPVDKIATALDAIQAKAGFDVPIHVDGASGAMIAPFVQPELVWDFRLDRVHSISTSGHKYGLVYPGLGWVVWRDRASLPEDLIFNVSYLGGSMPTLALNFSRPGAQVLLQYYLFLRLGMSGYASVQKETRDVALYLSAGVAKIGAFDLWSDGSDPGLCLAAEAGAHRQLESLPFVRQAADAGLAGSGVSAARQSRRPDSAANRCSQWTQYGHRRPASRRYRERDCISRCARISDAHRRGASRIPPLTSPIPVYGEDVSVEAEPVAESTTVRVSTTVRESTTVRVRYFAAAAEAAGCEEETLKLDDATLGALRAELESRYGAPMQRVMRSGSFLVDTVVSRDPARAISATVDVLPPFAGG